MNALADIRGNAGERERLRIRTAVFTGPTAGLAPGNVQASVGLSSTQMSAGLVRVRLREARLFQGSAVSLDTP